MCNVGNQVQGKNNPVIKHDNSCLRVIWRSCSHPCSALTGRRKAGKRQAVEATTKALHPLLMMNVC